MLLINDVLTVEADKPTSHKKAGKFLYFFVLELNNRLGRVY